MPEITWDGSLLTINAENSTLSDILAAVRARTGANIDMPPGSGEERIAVSLGPAPVRDVLSSLLYGTSFDYIIQASATNENGIQSVILTPRGKSEDLVAGAHATPASGGVRRMIGYAGSNKTTFQAAAESALENAAAAAEPAPAAEAVTTPPPDPVVPNAEPASASLQPAATSDSATSAQTSEAGSVAGMQGALTNTLATSEMTANQSPSSPPSVSDLQHMYEQRRQIQIQQNQAQQKQSPPARTN